MAARKLISPDDLLGPGEVQQLLGISRATFGRYREAGFPKPWRELEQGPIWLRSDVESWQRPARGRKKS